MAEKIEMFAGWDWDSSVIVGREMNQHLPNRCTVVVHDDKAERVFTESEVKAYGNDLLTAHLSPGDVVDRLDDEPLYRWISRAVKSVNEKHGISDPA
jgi:hypothetical protein